MKSKIFYVIHLDSSRIMILASVFFGLLLLSFAMGQELSPVKEKEQRSLQLPLSLSDVESQAEDAQTNEQNAKQGIAFVPGKVGLLVSNDPYSNIGELEAKDEQPMRHKKKKRTVNKTTPMREVILQAKTQIQKRRPLASSLRSSSSGKGSVSSKPSRKLSLAPSLRSSGSGKGSVSSKPSRKLSLAPSLRSSSSGKGSVSSKPSRKLSLAPSLRSSSSGKGSVSSKPSRSRFRFSNTSGSKTLYTPPVYSLQLGAFRTLGAAQRMAKDLRKNGFASYLSQSREFHHVRVGKSSLLKDIQTLEKELRYKNYSPRRFVVK